MKCYVVFLAINYCEDMDVCEQHCESGPDLTYTCSCDEDAGFTIENSRNKSSHCQVDDTESAYILVATTTSVRVSLLLPLSFISSDLTLWCQISSPWLIFS